MSKLRRTIIRVADWKHNGLTVWEMHSASIGTYWAVEQPRSKREPVNHGLDGDDILRPMVQFLTGVRKRPVAATMVDRLRDHFDNAIFVV